MPLSPAPLAFRRVVLGAACWAFGLAGSDERIARAADDAPATAPKHAGPLALSLTISGGVSLGAHEAGFLYYLTEVVKRNPNAFQLVTVTGASAGSINALITILETCAPPRDDPTASLFSTTWMPVGLEQLFVPKETSPVGVFSRRAFAHAVDGLEQAWNAGLPTSCDMVLGASTTRLVPVPLEVRSDLLRLPRLEERFVVRVRGQGVGKPLLASQYVDPRLPLEQALLPLDGPDARPFEAVRDLLYASSSFPIAFPPVSLPHCMSRASDGRPLTCTPRDARPALFIDGGVFDNQPLPLSASIARSGLVRKANGSFTWADVPDGRRAVPPEDFALGYLDPDAKAYPPLPTKTHDPTSSAFALAGQFLQTFVKGARSKGLVSFFADNPDLRDRVVVATSQFPLASEPLAAFFGFFETDFRRLDFTLGMLDARIGALNDPRLQRLALAKDAVPHMPEDAIDGLPPGRVPVGWRPFFCARAVIDDAADAGARCEGKELEDFRILLQVTLERLYDHCATLAEAGAGGTDASAASHLHCAAAMKGATPPKVLGVTPIDGKAWRKSPVDEADLDYTLRLLAAHRFWFKDLGLDRAHADRAPLAVRESLVRVIGRFRDVQPEGAVIFDAATTALNAFRYVPARHILHLSLGPVFEGGYSFTDPRWAGSFLRAAAAVKVEGITSAASNTGDYYVGLTPMAGFEVEPIALNGVTTQLRFGLRAGYLLSSGDGLGTGTCPAKSAVPCSRSMFDTFLAVSLLDRARFQLAGAISPALRSGDGVLWSLQPSIGIQFEP